MDGTSGTRVIHLLKPMKLSERSLHFLLRINFNIPYVKYTEFYSKNLKHLWVTEKMVDSKNFRIICGRLVSHIHKEPLEIEVDMRATIQLVW